MVLNNARLSISRQCELLLLNRTGVYYRPKELSSNELARLEFIRQRIDLYNTKQCYLGAKKLAKKLNRDDGDLALEQGVMLGQVGKKLVRRLMREMGIFCVYPKPNLSKPGKQHRRFPYLLRNKEIFLPNQVWAVDITYIAMGRSHMYLTAIIDWASRFIVGWSLSDTLETAPVIDGVKTAIERHGVPSIINSDQGSQFSSDDYIALLQGLGIRQSMDGKARWIDNVVIERWFRSLKCDNIYINEYTTPKELKNGIKEYIQEYNYERPHQALGYSYPADVYNYSQAA
jgi:putative transposase